MKKILLLFCVALIILLTACENESEQSFSEDTDVVSGKVETTDVMETESEEVVSATETETLPEIEAETEEQTLSSESEEVTDIVESETSEESIQTESETVPDVQTESEELTLLPETGEVADVMETESEEVVSATETETLPEIEAETEEQTLSSESEEVTDVAEFETSEESIQTESETVPDVHTETEEQTLSSESEEVTYNEEIADNQSADYKLIVIGKEIEESGKAVFDTEYEEVLISFEAVLKALNVYIGWTDGTTAIVGYEGTNYSLDTTVPALISPKFNINCFISAPGSTIEDIRYKAFDKEIFLDCHTVEMTLLFMGINVDINEDPENRTVEIVYNY